MAREVTAAGVDGEVADLTTPPPPALVPAPELEVQRQQQRQTPDRSYYHQLMAAPVRLIGAGVRLTLLPSCRIMMPPAGTGCPPYTFTPRRLELESRPFLQRAGGGGRWMGLASSTPAINPPAPKIAPS